MTSVRAAFLAHASRAAVQARLKDLGVEIPQDICGNLTSGTLLIEGVPEDLFFPLTQDPALQGVALRWLGGGRCVACGNDDAFRTFTRATAATSPLRPVAAAVGAALAGEERPPQAWVTSRRLLDLSRRPLVMGILNVTPDSFSDGGAFFDRSRAVDRGLQMEQEGADIIDLGGESTRPYAPEVPQEEELRRVVPVVEELARRVSIPISVDTYKAVVARRSLDVGAEIINDVSGFTFDPEMAATVAAAGAAAVLMHTRGRPAVMQNDVSYQSVQDEVAAALAALVANAERAGVAPAAIAVDPGLGFAKDRAANLELLRRLPELRALRKPVLVGASRKGFTASALGRATSSRTFATAAAVALAVSAGAAILRVHDVAAMRDVSDLAAEIARSG